MKQYKPDETDAHSDRNCRKQETKTDTQKKHAPHLDERGDSDKEPRNRRIITKRELPLENSVHSVQYIRMPITHLPSSSHTLKASTNALQHV